MAAVIFGCLSPLGISAADIKGAVIAVSDGDTLTVRGDDRAFTIRLAGIDAPEKRQRFGDKARRFAVSRVLGKEVRVEAAGTDRYGRIIGKVHYDGGCLNEELIRSGFAWVYRRYCKDPVCAEWMGLERAAAQARLALWSDSHPIAPWEFRHRGKGQRAKGEGRREKDQGPRTKGQGPRT